jgi:hypothetical protein
MLGRGAAIIAALLALGLRGLVAVIVGPILGSPINWFALYLGPALVIEVLALTPLIKRPIVFGMVSGLGVATVGLCSNPYGSAPFTTTHGPPVSGRRRWRWRSPSRCSSVPAER